MAKFTKLSGRINQDLIKALEEGDRMKEISMMQHKKPIGVMNAYGDALGQFAMDNYDINKVEDSKKLFIDPSKLEGSIHRSVPTSELQGNRALYLPKTKEILTDINRPLFETVPDYIHEGIHYREGQDKDHITKRLYNQGDKTEKLRDAITKGTYDKTLGLANAEKYWEGHHAYDDIAERRALQRLVRNSKIANMGMIGTGIAGALALASVPSDVYAGTLGGDPEGLKRAGGTISEFGADMFGAEKMGSGELSVEEQKKKDLFNKEHFAKLKLRIGK